MTVHEVMAHVVPAAASAEWARLTDRASACLEVLPCAGHGREYWFGSRLEQETAARACLECPLMVECGQYADAARERHGVWGGRTEWERGRRQIGAGL